MTLYNFSYNLNGDSSKHFLFALYEGLHIPTAVKSEYMYIYIVCIFEGVIALYYLENFIKEQLYLHYISDFPQNLLVYNYIRICIVLPQLEPALVA
jgi:hypothetical protein